MTSKLTAKSGPRPGGRSARVQAAVHAAVAQLQNEVGRASLTVPLIASRAGVTPSTIYRRWGDLADLLADVAVEQMRPDMEPPDTGSLSGDLQSWCEQYLDEMSSDVGRAMLKDALAGSTQSHAPTAAQPLPNRCFEFTEAQIELILSRARQRGDAHVPSAQALMDDIIAPIIYRLLFAPEPATIVWLRKRLSQSLRITTDAAAF